MFSAELRAAVADVWEARHAHPFMTGHGPVLRTRMQQAFVTGSRHELAFLDVGRDHRPREP